MWSDPEHEITNFNRSIAQLDNEIGELKKQNSQIIALAEKTYFF
jgi:hypothetical protein